MTVYIFVPGTYIVYRPMQIIRNIVIYDNIIVLDYIFSLPISAGLLIVKFIKHIIIIIFLFSIEIIMKEIIMEKFTCKYITFDKKNFFKFY